MEHFMYNRIQFILSLQSRLYVVNILHLVDRKILLAFLAEIINYFS